MDNYTGRVLGSRYVLKEVIGVGGMAVVYQALDNIDNKTVAVKILKDEYIANDEFRKRFKNESQAIAVLSHPNIVKVYDVSFGEKIQYIVMEYIEGITLKQYIQNNGALPWREAVLFTSQILRALEHAHEKGVIHRDIKPQNIMLLNDNKTIKVADFGIARFNNKETIGDSALGSVHYISPEQARGEVVDYKTDIYSAGVVLYEMLTGQLPFQSDSAVSVAIMQLQKEAELPRNINPSIPIGLEQITMHAMQKNVRSRYQSASEMLIDIDEFRRNPNTKFDYEYFPDKQQVQYRQDRRQNSSYASGTSVATEHQREYTRETVITQEYDESDYENEQIAKKSYTLPILIGIIFLLIVVIIGIAWYFFTNTEEVTVPEFVGKYIEEIRDDSEYKYFFDHGLIEENLVYTTEYDEGYIFYQSEESGKKMQVSSTFSSIIKLNIAYTSESMQVPQLDDGTKLQEARSILQKLGFKIATEAIVDTSVPVSTVIRTDPPAGKSVAYGSTVTIYYAIDNEGKVAVPNVVGLKLSAAQKDLEDLGLKVSIKYEQSSSSKAGIVLSQSIAADTTVISSNTEITLIVGISQNKTTTVPITLPKITNAEDMYESIYVYVGDTLYKTYSSVKLDGSAHTIELGGSEKTTFKIYIGTQVVCTGDIDFTSEPPAVSNQKDTEYKYEGETKETTTAAPTTTPPVTSTTAPTPTDITIPIFAGKQYRDYYLELVNAGFDKIEKVGRPSATVPEGQVISVSAGQTTFTPEEAFNAEITVYVSTGPEE